MGAELLAQFGELCGAVDDDDKVDGTDEVDGARQAVTARTTVGACPILTVPRAQA